MRTARKVAGAVTLTVAALAMTGGVAGATAQAKGRAPSVSGVVTAVDGDATPGVCGTAGATGSFTLTTTGATPTDHGVDVTAATAFAEKQVVAPTDADVCVGYDASAIGVQTGDEVAADAVSVRVPTSTREFGTVLSVNGVSDSGACGTADTPGWFSLSTLVDGVQVTSTVYVLSETKFKEPSVSGATFADLCVGDVADADGPVVDGSVLATSVKFHVPKTPAPLHVKGLVSSVNGDATAGTCGVADTAGSFVVTWTDRSGAPVDTTVDVTATTPYSARTGASSFAAVCVGSKSSVIGDDDTSGALDALAVATYPLRG